MRRNDCETKLQVRLRLAYETVQPTATPVAVLAEPAAAKRSYSTADQHGISEVCSTQVNVRRAYAVAFLASAREGATYP